MFQHEAVKSQKQLPTEWLFTIASIQLPSGYMVLRLHPSPWFPVKVLIDQPGHGKLHTPREGDCTQCSWSQTLLHVECSPLLQHPHLKNYTIFINFSKLFEGIIEVWFAWLSRLRERWGKEEEGGAQGRAPALEWGRVCLAFSLLWIICHVVLNGRHEFTLVLQLVRKDWLIAQSSFSMIIWDCKRGRESSASPARTANVTVSLTVTRQNKRCVRTAVTGQVSVLTGHHGSIWQVVPDECCPSLVNAMVGDTFHRLAWLLRAPPRGRWAAQSHLQAFGSPGHENYRWH